MQKQKILVPVPINTKYQISGFFFICCCVIYHSCLNCSLISPHLILVFSFSEIVMEFPKRSRSCESHRSTSANECTECLVLNKELCDLCGKQVLFGSLSDKIVIEGYLPGICQCFSGYYETSYALGSIQTKQPVAEICASVNRNEKDLLVSSEESEIYQANQSSNGYISSLDELPNLADCSSEETNPISSGVVNSYSSSYPLSRSESSPILSERESSFDETGSNNYSDFKRSDKSTYSGSPQSDQKPINPRLPMGEIESKNTTNEQNRKDVSAEIEKFVFNNPDISISKVRPVLPRPFPLPTVQPCSQLHPPTISPSSSMQMPRPYSHIHPQQDPHLQSYSNTIMNKPVIQTNFQGRFPVSARPQLTPSYQNKQNDQIKGLRKKFLAQTQQADSGQSGMKKERIEGWLDEMEFLPPELLPPSDSGWASVSARSIASNEENEGIPPTVSGTSTDERSSTEISEEENRRQRLRRPPRHFRGKTN